MEINEFQTAGEWYKKMKAEGYTVPLSLYHTLIKIMKDERISFPVAYQKLQAEGRIKEIDKSIIFDL